MKSNFQNESFRLSWLLTPERDDLIFNSSDKGLQRVSYNLPPEVGEAWIDTLAFPDGSVLYHAIHAMEPSPRGQLIPLLYAEGVVDEPFFNAQILLSGLICHHEYWKGREHPPVEVVAFPSRDTFRYKTLWQAKVLVEGGVTSEIKSVVIPLSTMKTMLSEPVVDSLLKRLGLSPECQTVVFPMPAHVTAPLRNAMSDHFTGAARKLYAQARILDYLAGLINFTLSDNLLGPTPVPDKKIDSLHHHLISLEGSIPTLLDLAKEFGVSARRLNSDFAAKFGQSIYNFVTDHRLTQAHAALLSEPVPLKTLAKRLGYSHVNNFSAAFKKKFGYRPGSLRRR
jgi:AraC-like DNA-binding protein